MLVASDKLGSSGNTLYTPWFVSAGPVVVFVVVHVDLHIHILVHKDMFSSLCMYMDHYYSRRINM